MQIYQSFVAVDNLLVYMLAPELLLGAPVYGSAVDMFSAGLVLFQVSN